MEDEFELISKQELENLRKQLTQNRSQNKPSNSKNSQPKNNSMNETNIQVDTNIKEIIEAIKQEGNKDRELIMSELNQIKDLNKTTLTNVLERTDRLDSRIETLVGAISEIVGSIKDLIEDNSENSMKNELHGLLDKLAENNINDNSEQYFELITKVDKIDDFMEKLKILLSQIQPSNISMSAPIQPSTLPSEPEPNNQQIPELNLDDLPAPPK